MGFWEHTAKTPMQNPYNPPQSEVYDEEVTSQSRQKKCTQCGSSDTYYDMFEHPRFNIITFLLIGWVYLLVRYAFHSSKLTCSDCDHEFRHKSVGSTVALFLFVLLAASWIYAAVAGN